MPRWLAMWGLVGYAVFLTGALLELLGVAGIGLPLSILGGLFEIVFGVWLIVKGFRSSVASVRAHSTQVA